MRARRGHLHPQRGGWGDAGCLARGAESQESLTLRYLAAALLQQGYRAQIAGKLGPPGRRRALAAVQTKGQLPATDDHRCGAAGIAVDTMAIPMLSR